VNDPTDPIGVLRLLLPGGPFTFRMKNVTLAGGPVIPAAIFAPQHCGLPDTNMGNPPGAKCNVQVIIMIFLCPLNYCIIATKDIR
jgi:hypothetical protein